MTTCFFWASRVINFADLPDNDFLLPIVERVAANHAAVLGVPESVARELLTIHPADMNARWIELVVDLRGAPNAHKAKPRAAEFLDGVLASLEERLIDWHVEAAGVGRAQRELNDVRDLVTQRRAQFRGAAVTCRGSGFRSPSRR